MGELIGDESTYSPPPVESDWLTFEEGTTTIRLLSHSYHFRMHYIRSQKKSYDCAGDVSVCKWCQEGNRSSGKWAYLVVVRDEKAPVIKIMEAGWSIFESILNLAKDKDYGDPRGYDLKVVRTGTGTDTSYTVIPGKDKAFTDKEMKLIEAKKVDTANKASDYVLSFYKDKKKDVKDESEEDIPFE